MARWRPPSSKFACAARCMATGPPPTNFQGSPDTMDNSALDLRFSHAFDIRINFDKRWLIGPISGGANVGYTSVGAGSTVSGPRLNGRLVDYSGADWPMVRQDGVVELNAHYMIEADDGARIYIRNRGYVHGPLRVPGQAQGESPAVPAYFRCT